MKVIIYIATIIILSSAVYGSSGDINAKCLKCHASETLKLLDPVSGIVKDFHVDPTVFAKSNHKNLECKVCHGEGLEKWPHTDSLRKDLTCITCHGENSIFVKENPTYEDKFAGVKAIEIHKEFEKSFHFKKFGDDFSCFSCHDPHEFKRDRSTSKTKIKQDNEMCMSCHVSDKNRGVFADREFPSVENAHNWLPDPEIHWETVRCIDCHTSYEAPNLSHNILPAEKAVKDCESCHTKNTILMTKLYKYEHQEAVNKNGFVNGVLLNNAYVIGSTRNDFLDNLSIILFILVVLGLVTHGSIRFIAVKKGRKDHD